MKTQKLTLPIIMLAALLASHSTTFAKRFSIDVRNYEFSPSSLTTVQVGDTIHWEWKDGSHTTTSTSIPSGAASWDHPINSSNQSFDYVPAFAGTYNYKCTPHASMGMVGSFTVLSPAAIDDPAPPISLLLYPNPFVDKVTVVIQGDNGRTIKSLRVYNGIGNLLLTDQSFPPGQASSSRDILLGGLPSGILFFEFRDSRGGVYIRRMIKQ